MEIILVCICAVLWLIGGQKQSWARDINIPILIGGYFALTQNWLLGLLLVGACNIIRMGYGAFDPINDDTPSFWAAITNDRNGWWIRSIVGAMYGISTMSVMLFWYHDPFSILKAVLFTLQNSLASFLVCRLKMNIVATDLIVGASFGSILIWF